MTEDSGDIRLRVNGIDRTVQLRAVDDVLVDYLRDELGQVDVKIGCREGACGACSVLVNGQPHVSCLTYLGRLESAEIRTPADLAEDPKGRQITEALVSNRALQCGFCTPGVLCALYALSTSEDELAQSLRGHLCRCTGYERILETARSVLSSSPVS